MKLKVEHGKRGYTAVKVGDSKVRTILAYDRNVMLTLVNKWRKAGHEVDDAVLTVGKKK